MIGGDAESPPLDRCTQLRAVVDETEQTVADVHLVPGSDSALQVIVSPSVLQSLGSAKRSASLARCGSTWQIAGEAQAAILKFVARFRETAQRYGQWDPNESIGDGAEHKGTGR
jgi:hypothetical protein